MTVVLPERLHTGPPRLHQTVSKLSEGVHRESTIKVKSLVLKWYIPNQAGKIDKDLGQAVSIQLLQKEPNYMQKKKEYATA